MRKRITGYVPEIQRGKVRHRVRVEGQKKKRISIPVGPDDPTFWEYYYAARAGRVLANVKNLDTAAPQPVPSDPLHAVDSLRRLCDDYLLWLGNQVTAGAMSMATLTQRRSLLSRVCEMKAPDNKRTVGEFHVDLPTKALVYIIDQWGSKTAQADNTMKALSAAFTYGMDRGRVSVNNVRNVKRVHVDKGGAVPWSTKDIKSFLDAHQDNFNAKMWLYLAAYTGARISDLFYLGREHESVRDGNLWLSWQPVKKGSAYVSLPVADQLREIIELVPYQDGPYIRNRNGTPMKSKNVLNNSVQQWVKKAGLSKRSSHGLRKSLANFLSESGATDMQVMSVLAHTKTATTSIYTKKARRSVMSSEAIKHTKNLKL